MLRRIGIITVGRDGDPYDGDDLDLYLDDETGELAIAFSRHESILEAGDSRSISLAPCRVDIAVRRA